MKHPTPKRLTDWQTMPRFCHSCEHYEDNGQCRKYQQAPPRDFAETEDACKEWVAGVPF